MQKSETIKKLITNLLIVFVLVTIGYSLGKHNTLAKMNSGKNTTQLTGDIEPQIRVYYMHSTFRCVTCNDVEARTIALVDKEFAKEKADGRLQWFEVNFQENEILAKQFDVVASCVVIAVVKNNEISSFERLDEVWTLLEKPDEFDNYVLSAFKNAFTKLSGEL